MAKMTELDHGQRAEITSAGRHPQGVPPAAASLPRPAPATAGHLATREA